MRLCYVLLSPTWGMHQYTADLANRMQAAGHEVHVVTTRRAPRDRYSPAVAFHTPISTATTGFSLEGLNPRAPRICKNLQETAISPAARCRPLYRASSLEPVAASVSAPGRHPDRPHPARSAPPRRGGLWPAPLPVERLGAPPGRSPAGPRPVPSSGADRPGPGPGGRDLHAVDPPVCQLRPGAGSGVRPCRPSATSRGRCWPGGWRPTRGWTSLVEAVWQLEKEAVGYPLAVVAGPGSLRGLVRGILPPGLEVRNHLIEDDEAIDLFSRCGLVVLPYVEASQSALVAAAYFFHKPVIVTRAGALPEYVVDGETGWVIPPGDPRALADALRAALSDPARLAHMGQAARAWYDRERQAETTALQQMYDSLTSKG